MALEVSDGEAMVAVKLKTTSTSRRTDNGKAPARQKEVVVGNGVIKNVAYMASNPNKHSKDANKATQLILVELDQNNSEQLQVASVREIPDPGDPS
ncbi:hypothetical protein V6N12_042682 [Hibiscus sabdariffa]|uniref:Uncharacterized protein n=1 Tax=Hibiscus sabdariffa TaxID=183260 RepID=A0ABR2B5L4_9ROSI